MHGKAWRSLLALVTVFAVGSTAACGGGTSEVGQHYPDFAFDRAVFQLDKDGHVVEGAYATVKGAKKSFTFYTDKIGPLEGSSFRVHVYAPKRFVNAKVHFGCTKCKNQMNTPSDGILKADGDEPNVVAELHYERKPSDTYPLILELGGEDVATGGTVIMKPEPILPRKDPGN